MYRCYQQKIIDAAIHVGHQLTLLKHGLKDVKEYILLEEVEDRLRYVSDGVHFKWYLLKMVKVLYSNITAPKPHNPSSVDYC